MSTTNRPLAAIILAAGQGKRMHSDLPKVLNNYRGRPMIRWVVDVARQIGAAPIIAIVGYKQALVRQELASESVEFAVQEAQLGTGHAVLQAQALLANFAGDVLILSGDVPAITPTTLQKLIATHKAAGAAATMLTANAPDPTGYGRVLKDEAGHFLGVVEEQDATASQKAINEINGGIYLFDGAALFNYLPKIGNLNKQHEYYLPEVLYIMQEQKSTITVELAEHFNEILGANTKADLRRLND